MKVLVIKTSSLGDVIHTLPAVSEAAAAIPDIQFDWVVEKAFQDIPALHPSVSRVIPVSIRVWRKNPFKHRAEIRACIKAIRQQQYDVVIDAQGLIKSALLTRFARGKRCGLSQSSCREGQAAWAYQTKIDVEKGQHAITRVRQLFAGCLGYTLDDKPLSYGLQREAFTKPEGLQSPYVVFLHATTWVSKHWPDAYWKDLIALAVKQGLSVYLPWGNKVEKERAEMLAQTSEQAYVLPRTDLKALTAVLMHAQGVVGVDSGLAHLTAACHTPAVTLYGSTSSVLTGTMGPNNRCLQADFSCSPCLKKECKYDQPSDVKPACYQTLPAKLVWQTLSNLMP